MRPCPPSLAAGCWQGPQGRVAPTEPPQLAGRRRRGEQAAPWKNHPAQRRIAGGAPVYAISLWALVSAVEALSPPWLHPPWPPAHRPLVPGGPASPWPRRASCACFLRGGWASSMWLSGPRALGDLLGRGQNSDCQGADMMPAGARTGLAGCACASCRIWI